MARSTRCSTIDRRPGRGPRSGSPPPRPRPSRAAPAGSSSRSARPRPVVLADQHEAADRSRGERLRRQVQRAATAARRHRRVSRWPARVPARRARGPAGTRRAPPGRSAGDRRRDTAGGSHGGPRPPGTGGRADARRAHQRDRRQGHERTRHRRDSTRDLLRRGHPWREEGEVAMVTRDRLTCRLSALGAGGTLAADNRGPRVPADPTRFGREAGVIPAQSRYGDRPPGRKSGRRPAVAARAFERKVRRIVRSTA